MVGTLYAVNHVATWLELIVGLAAGLMFIVLIPDAVNFVDNRLWPEHRKVILKDDFPCSCYEYPGDNRDCLAHACTCNDPLFADGRFNVAARPDPDCVLHGLIKLQQMDGAANDWPS